jgi:hypothetical protein
MNIFRRVAAAVSAGLLLLDVAGAAVAQRPAEFFKGNTRTRES